MKFLTDGIVVILQITACNSYAKCCIPKLKDGIKLIFSTNANIGRSVRKSMSLSFCGHQSSCSQACSAYIHVSDTAEAHDIF